MKVWGIANGPAARGTKINGAYITVRQPDGSLVVRSWPRKRGHYQSQRQGGWGEWFAAVSRWATQPDPGSQLYALQVVVGTIFMPRDVLIKIAAGKLWDVQLADGTQLWNIWLMADQIQVMLDTITETPGSMLVRTPAGWAALEPGPVGNVLTGQGPNQIPAWALASGGAGAAGWDMPGQTSHSENAFATVGGGLQPAVDVTIDQVWSRLSEVAGATYKVSVLALDGTTISAVLGQTPEYQAEATADVTRVLNLVHKATIPAEQLAVIAVTRTDAGPTTTPSSYRSNLPYATFPNRLASWGVLLASVDPKVGDVMTHNTSGYNIGIHVTG